MNASEHQTERAGEAVQRPVAHTPGPWKVIPPRIGASITVYAERAGIYREVPVATTCSNTSPATMEMHRRGEVAANARLIAAAPELLEALQEMARHTTNFGRDKALAAIAKATGQQ